jgi:hypothetical protein
MATKAKAANSVATIGGSVNVDPETMYAVKLASAVRYLGMWIRPSDRNTRLRGDALLAVAETAREGTIIDVTPIQ